jgi:hypothetical protein
VPFVVFDLARSTGKASAAGDSDGQIPVFHRVQVFVEATRLLKRFPRKKARRFDRIIA